MAEPVGMNMKALLLIERAVYECGQLLAADLHHLDRERPPSWVDVDFALLARARGRRHTVSLETKFSTSGKPVARRRIAGPFFIPEGVAPLDFGKLLRWRMGQMLAHRTPDLQRPVRAEDGRISFRISCLAGK
jgi:hypothetical protein